MDTRVKLSATAEGLVFESDLTENQLCELIHEALLARLARHSLYGGLVKAELRWEVEPPDNRIVFKYRAVRTPKPDTVPQRGDLS